MTSLFYLIVLGFFATACLGLTGSWIDRKITARLQYRVGPPFFQPFIDILKLLGKETMIPNGASKLFFFIAPVTGLGSVAVVSSLLWFTALNPDKTFFGDLIVVVYLLLIPSLSIIMGGFASRNIYAGVGASREMKLILAYELPFIIGILVPVVKAGLTFKLGGIIAVQQTHIVLRSWSGILAFIPVMLAVQAKLGFVPFDVAEAETEIVGGPLIEYSGPGLGLYRLMKNMMLFTLPFLVMILFLGGVKTSGFGLITALLKYVAVLAVITVIRNTNPRVRIDQAVRFFWGPMTLCAGAALVLAFAGL